MPVYLKAILLCAVLMMISFFGYKSLKSEQFKVHDISFKLMDGHDPSSLFPKIEADLKPKLATLFGQYIWKLDLENLLTSIEKDRRLKDLNIVRRWPDKLQVEIRPHQAIANILGDKSNTIYPLTRDGGLLPPANLNEASDAPILRGSHFLKDQKLRKLTLELLLLIPEEGIFSLRNISEISFKEKEGLVLVLSPDGAEVIMGREDFAKRVDYVGRVIQYLSSENLRGRVIDSRFQKKVVVRLRNAS